MMDSRFKIDTMKISTNRQAKECLSQDVRCEIEMSISHLHIVRVNGM